MDKNYIIQKRIKSQGRILFTWTYSGKIANQAVWSTPTVGVILHQYYLAISLSCMVGMQVPFVTFILDHKFLNDVWVYKV